MTEKVSPAKAIRQFCLRCPDEAELVRQNIERICVGVGFTFPVAPTVTVAVEGLLLEL